jgi:hypothetical protein
MWNPEGRLPCSQELAAGSYPEPDESNVHPHALFHFQTALPLFYHLHAALSDVFFPFWFSDWNFALLISPMDFIFQRREGDASGEQNSLIFGVLLFINRYIELQCTTATVEVLWKPCQCFQLAQYMWAACGNCLAFTSLNDRTWPVRFIPFHLWTVIIIMLDVRFSRQLLGRVRCWPWRWMPYIPSKRRAYSDLHGVTSQDTFRDDVSNRGKCNRDKDPL